MTSERELEALARDCVDAYTETVGEGWELPATKGMRAVIELIARRLQPARVPEGYSLVPTFLAGQLHPGRWQEVWIGTKKRKLTITLDDAYWADVMSRLAAAPAAERGQPEPIRMVLHCPCCNVQHIDEPDERTPGWNNPPHRSHLCHACGCIWRPADVPTMGVASIETRGKADTWSPADHYPGAGNMVAEAGQREGVDVEELAQWCDEQSKDPDNADGAVTLLVIAQTLRGLASAQQAGTGSRGEGGDA